MNNPDCHQKTTLADGLVDLAKLLIDWTDTLISNIPQMNPVDLGYQSNLATCRAHTKIL